MIQHQTVRTLYQSIFKPIAFLLDAEFVHDRTINIGELLQNYPTLLSKTLAYQDKSLERKIAGINFRNPIGLAAGFDYDGHLAQVLKNVGFGFNTVGTVTAKPYPGNKAPRLGRLPKSGSLWVNKGFKSEGALKIASRLDKKNLEGHIIGISAGSTNSKEVDTVAKAIDDYLFTFDVFKNKKYVSYFELNISCPNTVLTEPFLDTGNFKNLVKSVACLKLKQPVFVKMPNSIEQEMLDGLIKSALEVGINGFIFSNLTKNRQSILFDKQEMEKFKGLGGNFSGKPVAEGANRLIAYSRKKFAKEIVIIGCGGVFSAEDVLEKLAAGADLVQLITGMIFEGPQLIGEICKDLVKKYEI